jgi:hypothetical protein
MMAAIRPTWRNLLAPKVLVPLAVVAWLLLSLTFALLIPPADAQTSGSFCSGYTWKKALLNVYSPSRLKRINTCQQASGTVTFREKWGDGDYDIYVSLDPESKSLVTQQDIDNLRYWEEARDHGNGPADMLWEAVPKDQGSCSGNKGLIMPAQGTHLQGTGAYVSDNGHRSSSGLYKELHRLYETVDLGTGQTCRALN